MWCVIEAICQCWLPLLVDWLEDLAESRRPLLGDEKRQLNSCIVRVSGGQGELMDQLIALPVAGDAFLLRRAGRVILVDGGKSSGLLIGELTKYGVVRLDIVICTHADHDHAGGLVNLLDRSRIDVGEFWLPGSWAESLPMLLKNPGFVVDDLIETLDEELHVARSNGNPEKFAERMHSYVSGQRRKHRKDNRVPGTYDSTRMERMAEGDGNGESSMPLDRQNEAGRWNAEQSIGIAAEENAVKAFRNGRGRIRYRVAKTRVSKPVASFWLGLIDTAERIYQIALQALRHGVKVRWFDFGEFAKTGRSAGGDRGFLIPLNAVELANPPPPPVGLSFLVRLTPLNEECLVFLSLGYKPYWVGPDILFTGDSPLGMGKNYSVSWLRWPAEASRCVVATAPHHGAESNLAAYDHLRNKADVIFWVRSGGNAGHPGPTYRRIDPSLRICTNCPRSKKPRKAAEIHFGKRPGWVSMHTHGHKCSC